MNVVHSVDQPLLHLEHILCGTTCPCIQRNALPSQVLENLLLEKSATVVFYTHSFKQQKGQMLDKHNCMLPPELVSQKLSKHLSKQFQLVGHRSQWRGWPMATEYRPFLLPW